MKTDSFFEEFFQNGSPSDVEGILAEKLAAISDQVRQECKEQHARAASILGQVVGGEPHSTTP